MTGIPIGQQWNPFSGDYWSSNGQAQRQGDVDASHGNIFAPLAMTGAALKGIGVPVDNIFGPLYDNGQQPASQTSPASSASRGSGQQSNGWQTNQFNNGQDMMASDQGQQAYDPRQSFMQAIGRPFQFDPSQVDTSMFDKILQSKMDQIQNTRNLAQSNFNLSNKNIGDMYNAFQNHMGSLNPGVQQQYQNAANQTSSIYGNAQNTNNDFLKNYNAQKAEMLQRLGIQAAGNAPDYVGQAVAQGDNALNQSQAASLARNNADSQTQQNFNTNMAALAGNEGVQRQQDLARSLANINTNLNNQGLSAQTQNDQDKLNWQRQMQGIAFQNYQNERDFNEKAMEQFNNYLVANRKADAAVARYNYGSGRNNPATQGMIGLNQAYSPAVSSAFAKLVGQGHDPAQAKDFYTAFVNGQKSDPDLQKADPNDVLAYLKSYNDLGKTNAFPMMDVASME